MATPPHVRSRVIAALSTARRIAAALATLALLAPVAGAPVQARTAPRRVPRVTPTPASRPATLTIGAPLGLAPSTWPVSAGVPFPRGRVRDPAALALKGAGGGAVPLQARALSRWDDGSVRWLLADFPVTVDAHGSRTVMFVPGSPTAPPSRVRVQEHPTIIEVDTGPLHFTVPRDHFAILQDVRLKGQTMLPGPLRAVLTTDRRSEPRAPKTVLVRESGPVRAQIELRGPLADGFDYVVRLHAYAGQPFVRVLFTFVATGPAAVTSLHQLAIEAPLPAAESRRYRLGIEAQPPAAGQVTASGMTLIQDDNLGFRLDGRQQQGHAAGWIETTGTHGGMAIAARFFWQEYPKSFRLQPDRLTYHLYPPEALPAPIGVGAAKTHEFTLLFFEHAPAAEFIAALRQPLIATLDPVSVVRSGALPNAVAPGGAADGFLRRVAETRSVVEARTAREVWDEAADATCPLPGAERLRTGAFGMLNWGDWNYPGLHDSTKGCDAWGNLEYDLTQVDALAFAATGAPAFHEAMTAAARHFMDVDVIHAPPARAKWLGMNHPKNPRHFSFARGGVDLGHTWTEGLVSYYFLTGDDRALEVARGIADYLVQRLQTGIRGGNPRQWGWPQIALLAVSRATGDARYQTAALVYARQGMKAHPPTGIENWKLGILADALADTHAATHEAEIEQWLRTYAAAVAAKPGGDPRLYPAVAYVAALTGDAHLAAAAKSVVERLQLGGWAKPFTIAGRTGFRILSLLPR